MFKRRKDIGFLPGTGLLVEMPSLTSERMVELFGHGAGMKTQRRLEYSDPVVVQDSDSDEAYTLYMRHGEWRIGGFHETKLPPTGKWFPGSDVLEYGCVPTSKNLQKLVKFLIGS